MHTAWGLKSTMFTVTSAGETCKDHAWLDWDVRDRLGVVVRSPAGGLGAGLLTLSSVVAFYDAPGRKRRMRPLYPDIFLFHVGQRWGCHAGFDFWPERKEILVADDANAILSAINDYGITHLALPDAPQGEPAYRYKERDAAIDRLKKAYAYAPLGDVADADIAISSSDPAAIKIFRDTLDPHALYARMMPALAADKTKQRGTPMGDDAHFAVEHLGERLDEIDPQSPAIIAQMARLQPVADVIELKEGLRTIDSKAALAMLGG